MKIRLLPALLVCLLCCSCASSKRMMRISPFSETRDKMPDPDRVNVWPLVYHNQDHSSVLWPIVDIDPQGFAVRPVFNKEQHDWSVLFPLSSYNTKRQVGWIGTLYHYEKYDGFFPLYHFGEDLDFIGPAWWTPNKTHGFFPLYLNGRYLDYLTLLWRETRDGKWTEAGLFPFVGFDREFKDLWVWPLYAHDLDGARKKYSALSGLIRSVKGEEGYVYRHVVPVYFDRKKGESHTRLLFPVLFTHEDSDSRVHINPLYGVGYNKEDQRVFTSVLGPLYLDFNPGNQRDRYVALISHFGTDGDKRSGRIWPLAGWSNEDRYPDFLYNLTLAAYRKKGDNLSMQCTPFIEHRKKGETQSSLLWPLAGYSTRRYYPNFLYNLNLLGARQHKDSREWHVTPLVGYNRYNPNDDHPGHSEFRVWPVLRTYASPTYKRQSFCFASSTKYYEDNELRRRIYKLPLSLARYDDDVQEDITKWSVLYGAMNYKQDRERSRFSVLKYLYRRDREGDTVARDIFPFIKWDSGPDKSRFALLWRLLNVQTEDGTTRGHVLFVPFGGKK